MILDTLDNLHKYVALHPLFAAAFDFIKSKDLNTSEVGKFELKGEDLIVTVAQSGPKQKEEAKLEAHRKYIDIQIPLSGIEYMGYSPVSYCNTIDSSYDDENDISFYNTKIDTYITVKPGMFVIFFPQDAHAPAITPDGVKKIIIKVKA